jgi:O-antigen ligase
MLAAAAGGAVALAAIAAVVTLANPHGLSSATGRSNSELAATTEFRLATWDEVIDRWSQRPAIGFGPGQGAVKLATRLPSYATPDGSRPLVLGTAEGLWAAALLDGGVLALAAWLTFLGTLGWLGWRTVLARPNALIVAAFAAMIAAVIGSQVGGDRLELRVWVLFGLLAALSGIAHRHRQTGDRQAA